jgi:hypothetical protein
MQSLFLLLHPRVFLQAGGRNDMHSLMLTCTVPAVLSNPWKTSLYSNVKSSRFPFTLPMLHRIALWFVTLFVAT